MTKLPCCGAGPPALQLWWLLDVAPVVAALQATHSPGASFLELSVYLGCQGQQRRLQSHSVRGSLHACSPGQSSSPQCPQQQLRELFPTAWGPVGLGWGQGTVTGWLCLQEGILSKNSRHLLDPQQLGKQLAGLPASASQESVYGGHAPHGMAAEKGTGHTGHCYVLNCYMLDTATHLGNIQAGHCYMLGTVRAWHCYTPG